jgi:pSer/pThr/pTyr-binding forkhead associated (FHA) protein
VSDIALPEAAIAPLHLQFSCQPEGDYVHDMTGHVSSQINGLPLRTPQLLKAGDVITLGNVQLEYILLPEAQTTTIPLVPPAAQAPRHLPFPLQLPSKKQNT